MLLIGKIVNTFGIKGELKIVSQSDHLDERFAIGNTVYFNEDEAHTITSYRIHKGNALITIDDLKDINDVEHHINKTVSIKVEKEDNTDELFVYQLRDLEVYENNEYIGTVIEVDKPHQTIITVKSASDTFMIPFVESFIKNVDLEKGRIDVELIEGMR